MKNWMKGGRRLMAGLLTGALLMGLSGCQKEPEPVIEPEPVDGEGTNKTDYNAPKEIASKDITLFSTSFFQANRWTSSKSHDFEFQIRPDEGGALTASEEVSGIRVPADETLLHAVQEIIDKYDLVKKNGVYEVNYSLSPEYQKCTLTADYASGETLRFTDLNDPYAQWSEEIYDVFSNWFQEKGNDSLLPEKETSPVTRIGFTYDRNFMEYDYSVVHVSEENAVNGDRYPLMLTVYDWKEEKSVSSDYRKAPEDFYERITEILFKYDPVTKYDFSSYSHKNDNYSNHDDGYFGWGITPAEEEPDEEGEGVELYLEYEDGKHINIETRKRSELDGMKPLVEELAEYYSSLFE